MMALREFLARVEARKAMLGLTETATETEALRTKGARRTPEKRALLKRVEERAGQSVKRSTIISYR